MKIAFITEMGFQGQVPTNHPNARTEFAWMIALDAIHYNTSQIQEIKDYDKVFFIFPKGKTFLSAEGSKLVEATNPVSLLLQNAPAIIQHLKTYNKEVYFIQEGPVWWFNDYELIDQINFIKAIRLSDGIYAHNQHDVKFWKGYTQKVFVMPTLMIEETIKDLKWQPEEKCIIGGNFSHWYGGMQSYIVAQEFGLPIYTIESHSQRAQEEQMVNHIPRLQWTNFMNELAAFKYAVHLMPTAAAGTFSLNCAYFGIPCIGNQKMDTQRLCFPELSVDVEDVEKAAQLAIRLKNDALFYEHCSKTAKEMYRREYDIKIWKSKIGL